MPEWETTAYLSRLLSGETQSGDHTRPRTLQGSLPGFGGLGVDDGKDGKTTCIFFVASSVPAGQKWLRNVKDGKAWRLALWPAAASSYLANLWLYWPLRRQCELFASSTVMDNVEGGNFNLNIAATSTKL